VREYPKLKVNQALTSLPCILKAFFCLNQKIRGVNTMTNYLYALYGNNAVKKQLGEDLHRLRIARKMTLVRLSQKVDISVGELDRIELGISQHINLIKRLCAFYGKQIILCLEDVPQEKTSENT